MSLSHWVRTFLSVSSKWWHWGTALFMSRCHQALMTRHCQSCGKNGWCVCVSSVVLLLLSLFLLYYGQSQQCCLTLEMDAGQPLLDGGGEEQQQAGMRGKGEQNALFAFTFLLSRTSPHTELQLVPRGCPATAESRNTHVGELLPICNALFLFYYRRTKVMALFLNPNSRGQVRKEEFM